MAAVAILGRTLGTAITGTSLTGSGTMMIHGKRRPTGAIKIGKKANSSKDSNNSLNLRLTRASSGARATATSARTAARSADPSGTLAPIAHYLAVHQQAMIIKVR